MADRFNNRRIHNSRLYVKHPAYGYVAYVPKNSTRDPMQLESQELYLLRGGGSAKAIDIIRHAKSKEWTTTFELWTPRESR